MTKKIEKNAKFIEKELLWLDSIIKYRIENYINLKNKKTIEPELPGISKDNNYYTQYIEKYNLNIEERKIILLALAPSIKPSIFDQIYNYMEQHGTYLSDFGEMKLQTYNGFIPTVKTALYILHGNNTSQNIKSLSMFDKNSKLYKNNILKEFKTEEGCPVTHKHLSLTDSALSFITTGKDIEHQHSLDFPAQKLTTLMEWEDLVLSETTSNELDELILWPQHGKRLIEELNMQKNVVPGYRALFYGPSGTGKTITAALIGKKVKKPVYRIDLSQVVSKYIGETEKNLEKIFKIAENKNWILFFDEADALFGKRTEVKSSNDRFANQEIAYLLQKVESCDNIVILASNLKENVDKAFSRRFQSIIEFPLPEENERLLLWQKALPKKINLESSIDLNHIAKKCEIAGGSIVNVVRYATLVTISKNSTSIIYNDLVEGIRREYAKNGISLYGLDLM